MITIKETQGDTLLGVIDGVNTTYVVSVGDFYNSDQVNIYVNGRLKIRDWDDGFTVTMPRTVVLKEPLLVGDSLEVEYQSGIKTGGGADGGCPSKPEIIVNRPTTRACQDIPNVTASENVPGLVADDMDMELVADDLKPTVLAFVEE